MPPENNGPMIPEPASRLMWGQAGLVGLAIAWRKRIVAWRRKRLELRRKPHVRAKLAT
jgi:hypothetical protein